MSDEKGFPFPGSDAFTAFWADFMKKAGTAGPMATPSPDVMAHMRQAFFDSLAEHADRFMRSEAFLATLKQSMDNALAWQQALNQFLQKGISAAQMPSRADSDHMVVLLRGMEDRLLRRIDEISERVARIEQGDPESSKKPTKPEAADRSKTR